MAIDMHARTSWGRNDWAYLFRYLNGQSTTRQLEILEDLQSVGAFVATFKSDHKAEWDKCGIGDGGNRLELSGILALEKTARMKTWNQFVEANATRFRRLPDDWQTEMQAFWSKGPNPGLGATAAFTPLAPPPGADYWKVTDFSVASVAGVQTVGVTAMWGKITFSTYNEPVKTSERTIGLVGISAGKSMSKLPVGLPDAFKARFPALAKFLLEEDYSAAEAAIKKAFPESMEKVTRYMPAVNKLWAKVTSSSAGAADWPSTASGPAYPLKHANLVAGDFRGTCYGFGVGLTVAVYGGAGFALTFGMDDWKSPMTAKGRTGFYSRGWSGQVPSVGVTGSAFWGEIV